jgi:hypothetical protein
MTDDPAAGSPAGGGPLEIALRDVVIHLNNEQPVLADLFNVPSPRDVAVICTNLRTPDGKRPVFIDRSDSIFVLPLVHVRFIEVPPGSDRPGDAGGSGPGRQRQVAPVAPVEPDLEIDEEFLRRIRDA